MRICSALLLNLAIFGCSSETPARSEAPAWSLEEELTIDGGPQGFTNAVSVIADQEDNVYIADQGEAHIRVFDAQGKAVRTIGRKGAGPAEFGELYSLAWLGDTLVTLDPANARLGFMARNGRWLTQWPIRPISGNRVRLTESRDAVYAPGALIRDDRLVMAAVRHTASGPGDTLEIPNLRDQAHPTGIDCFLPDGSIRGFDVAFASRPITTTSPLGEMVAARSGEYRIVFLRPDGDTARVVTNASVLIPVSSGEWADSMADYIEWKEKNSAAECDPDDPPAPATRPVLVDIWFDDDDQMWVERRDARGRAYDIFSPEGDPIATIPAVERYSDVLPYVRNERLYLVATAESGAQVVKVYSVMGQ